MGQSAIFIWCLGDNLSSWATNYSGGGQGAPDIEFNFIFMCGTDLRRSPQVVDGVHQTGKGEWGYCGASCPRKHHHQ